MCRHTHLARMLIITLIRVTDDGKKIEPHIRSETAMTESEAHRYIPALMRGINTMRKKEKSRVSLPSKLCTMFLSFFLFHFQIKTYLSQSFSHRLSAWLFRAVL